MENIILYGPPGTGKTYYMQKLFESYTAYKLSDEEINRIFIIHSFDWLLVSMILLQANKPLSNSEIEKRVTSLNIKIKRNVSTITEEHSQKKIKDLISYKSPSIFICTEDGNHWFLDIEKLKEVSPYFFCELMNNDKIEKRYAVVTFHQSFAYEDFIEGIRPVIDSKKSEITYSIQDGIFKKICSEAEGNPEKEYAIFIDEINRGNISEIFGELISLIELDKRKGEPNELSVVLPYSKTSFSVPKNLSIIATMNSTDKSIAMLDLALRRRFKFKYFSCDYDKLKNSFELDGYDASDIDGIDLILLLRVLNTRLNLLLSEDFVIGHSYFIGAYSYYSIKEIILTKLIPLFEEYFYDNLQMIQLVLNDREAVSNEMIGNIFVSKTINADKYFLNVDNIDVSSKESFFINCDFDKNSILNIYEGF